MGTPWELFKATAYLRWFGWWKIPLLAFTRPTVEALDDTECVVRLPLNRRTKNHLGSMYFGALGIGSDCAAGLLAAALIRKQPVRVSLVFKSFSAAFLKRPEYDVYFVCDEGPAIRKLLDQVLASPDRQTIPVKVRGEVRPPSGPEVVADFVLELSLKQAAKGAL